MANLKGPLCKWLGDLSVGWATGRNVDISIELWTHMGRYSSLAAEHGQNIAKFGELNNLNVERETF